MLDPVDGTANFVKGIPLYAVSLALVTRQEPVLGIIDVPADGCRYMAALGVGSLLVRRSDPGAAHEATQGGDRHLRRLCRGEHAEIKNQARLAVTSRLAERALRVRVLGSAAIDLA